MKITGQRNSILRRNKTAVSTSHIQDYPDKFKQCLAGFEVGAFNPLTHFPSNLR